MYLSNICLSAGHKVLSASGQTPSETGPTIRTQGRQFTLLDTRRVSARFKLACNKTFRSLKNALRELRLNKAQPAENSAARRTVSAPSRTVTANLLPLEIGAAALETATQNLDTRTKIFRRGIDLRDHKKLISPPAQKGRKLGDEPTDTLRGLTTALNGIVKYSSDASLQAQAADLLAKKFGGCTFNDWATNGTPDLALKDISQALRPAALENLSKEIVDGMLPGLESLYQALTRPAPPPPLRERPRDTEEQPAPAAAVTRKRPPTPAPKSALPVLRQSRIVMDTAKKFVEQHGHEKSHAGTRPAVAPRPSLKAGNQTPILSAWSSESTPRPPAQEAQATPGIWLTEEVKAVKPSPPPRRQRPAETESTTVLDKVKFFEAMGGTTGSNPAHMTPRPEMSKAKLRPWPPTPAQTEG